MGDNVPMSHFFDRVWNRLPETLQDKLRAHPDASLSEGDMEALERAGIPTIHMEGMELESDLEEPSLSTEFQDWIRSHG